MQFFSTGKRQVFRAFKHLNAVGFAARSVAADAALAHLVVAGYRHYGPSPIDGRAQWAWRVEPARAFVVHIASQPLTGFENAKLFRDYLRAYPEKGCEYQERKRALDRHGEGGHFAYTIRKLPVLLDVIEQAHAWAASIDDARVSSEFSGSDV